jgi:hypothetical protein
MGRNRREPIDYDDAFAKLDELADERTQKWEMVLLLGNPETITAARTWHRHVWQFEFFARGERTDAGQYDALHHQVDTDRTRFYEAGAPRLRVLPGGHRGRVVHAVGRREQQRGGGYHLRVAA